MACPLLSLWLQDALGSGSKWQNEVQNLLRFFCASVSLCNGPEGRTPVGFSLWLQISCFLVRTGDELDTSPGTPEPWCVPQGQNTVLAAMDGGRGDSAILCHAVLVPSPMHWSSTHHASQFGMLSSLVSRDALHARSRSSFLTGRQKGSQGHWGHVQTPP